MEHLHNSNAREIRIENTIDMFLCVYSGLKSSFKVRVSSLLGAAGVALLLSAMPAHGQEGENEKQEINILTGCVQIDDTQQGNVLVCDNPLFKRYNDILNEGGSNVINVDGFWDFLQMYGPVLEHLYPAGVDSGDIISAMNLYDAERIKDTDYIGYTLRYLDFMGGYPNPELGLDDILKERGVYLYD